MHELQKADLSSCSGAKHTIAGLSLPSGELSPPAAPRVIAWNDNTITAKTLDWVCAKRLEVVMIKGKIHEKLRQRNFLFVCIFNP